MNDTRMFLLRAACCAAMTFLLSAAVRNASAAELAPQPLYVSAGESALQPLYESLVKELREVLQSPRQAVPLPQHVDISWVDGKGIPWFSVLPPFKSRELSEAEEQFCLASAALDHGGFRLVMWGAVIGETEGRMLLQINHRRLAELTADGVRLLANKANVSFSAQCAWDGKRWLTRKLGGIHAWSLSAEPVLVARAEPALLNLAQWQNGGLAWPDAVGPEDQDACGTLKLPVTLMKDGTVTEEKWLIAKLWRPWHILESSDGKPLLIGKRIVCLEPDLPAKPDRKLLDQLFTALQSDDATAVDRLLARATLYAYEPKELEELQRRVKDLPASAGGNAQTVGRDPTAVVRHLSQGHQWYESMWVWNIRPLWPPTRRRDCVFLTAMHPTTDGKDVEGLFRLEANGKLHQETNLPPRSDDGTRFSVVRGPDAKTYILLRGKGMAEAAAGNLNWLAQGGIVSAMSQVSHVDGSGRAYLTDQVGLDALPVPVLWVLNLRKAADEPAPAQLMHTTFYAGVDAKRGRIWFTVTPKDLPQTVETATAHFKAPGDLPVQQQGGMFGVPVQRGGILCSAESGRVTRWFEAPGLEKHARLLVGPEGQLLALPFYTSDPVFLIQDGEVTKAKSLHVLAQQQFTPLLSLAPATEMPLAYGTPTALVQYRAVVRTDNLLWVNDNFRCEVYRDGKALGLAEQVGSNYYYLALAGPVKVKDQVGMLVITKKKVHGGARWHWVTVIGDHVVLNDGSPPAGEGKDDDTFPFNLDIAASITPLTDAPRDLAKADTEIVAGPGYVSVFGTRMWRTPGVPSTGSTCIDPAGVAFLTRSGAVLSEPGYNGVSLTREDGTSRNLEIACRRRLLSICAEEADGRLLCLVPDGLMWLRPDKDAGYVLDKTQFINWPLMPTLYLGQYGEWLYVANPLGQLAMIRMPPPAKP